MQNVTVVINGTSVPCVEINNKKIVNLMKHPATIQFPNGESTVLPTSGIVASVTTKTITGKGFGGLPTITSELGEVAGLPRGQRGVMFYVNMVTFNACCEHMNGRYDLIMGDSSGTEIRWTEELIKESFGDKWETKKFLIGLMKAVTTLKLSSEDPRTRI